MLAKERGQLLLSYIPIERLLTETDGPFTLPDVRRTVDLIAELRSASEEETRLSITRNLKQLLKSSSA
jgi:TatD DNase family protein